MSAPPVMPAQAGIQSTWRRKVRYLVAPFLLFQVACGTTPSVAVKLTVPATTSFSFSDDRPADQRTSHKDSSSTGTTTFYADDNLSPSSAGLFKATLEKRLSKSLAGRRVVLNGFVVYVSDPAVSIDADRYATTVNTVPNASLSGAVLALPLILGIESIKSQKVVNVEIRGRLDDEEFVSLHSERFRGRVTEENVRSTLLGALEQVLEEMCRIGHLARNSGGDGSCSPKS